MKAVHKTEVNGHALATDIAHKALVYKLRMQLEDRCIAAKENP